MTPVGQEMDGCDKLQVFLEALRSGTASLSHLNGMNGISTHRILLLN